MSLIDSYTVADVTKWLGAKEVEKGRPYVEAVSALAVQKNIITALVQGTRTKPYSVKIDLSKDGYKSFYCSCPVAHSCKHAAAVLLKVIDERQNSDSVNPSVLSWLDNFVGDTKEAATKKASSNKARLFYLLERDEQTNDVTITFVKANVNKEGKISSYPEPWSNLDKAILKPPQFVDTADLSILRQLFIHHRRDSYGNPDYPIKGQHGSKILRQILSTGKLLIENNQDDYLLLKSGTTRHAELKWENTTSGHIQAVIATTPKSTFVIPGEPLWFVDSSTQEIGQVEFDIPSAVVDHLIKIPPLTAKEYDVVTAILADLVPTISLPNQAPKVSLTVIDDDPTPVLKLDTVSIKAKLRRYNNPRHQQLDYAELRFKYGGVLIETNHKGEFITQNEGEIIQIKRKPEMEKKLAKGLAKYSLSKIESYYYQDFLEGTRDLYGFYDENRWHHFITHDMASLKAEGWDVQIGANFRHYSLEVDEWQADISESESGWFDLDMGIIVAGERLALTPLLVNLFQRDARWLNADQLNKIKDNEAIAFQTSQGERFSIPAERLKPLAKTLIDLFDGQTGAGLRISEFDAPRIAELFSKNRWQFNGEEAIQRLANRLSHTQGVTAITPPRDFKLELRSYQRDGLAWLQFLRSNDLSGILADDMGLGKTAQTLAHLLLEKEAGRLQHPALIVLPTSLIFNWRHELARFAPTLSVLTLHGADRHSKFPQIIDSDVILTTYPLLWRDYDEIKKHQFHYLILDEAQMVKNSKTRAAHAIRNIDAKHRLCLTGTPLENHLGELWSQFDFLLPGFLGDQKSFTRIWRTPIEKHGDNLRREVLAKRLKPFILRRRKEDVAKELPAKTTIIRSIELEGSQRDLYEAVRSAMDEKVRAAVAANGFKRSQIVILDALLKLRQVCCDPRLLTLENAKKVKERAKLQLLMDMLQELLAENRRILVFSQFTSMLTLIEEALAEQAIPYVLLTGKTKNRQIPVEKFQKGEVPLFLISLKSGGVGLNLTAADTVIHYDPWWNPAVENQATDRAHRLGQDKPIFVYKLIVAGSIEERILSLQEKKAQLVASILSEDHQVEVKFGEDDLRALFAPLPE